jgi:hypothetical protein
MDSSRKATESLMSTALTRPRRRPQESRSYFEEKREETERFASQLLGQQTRALEAFPRFQPQRNGEDLDSSYTDIPTPYSDPDEELPFHFIGAAEYEEPDYESFSDISSHLAG